jgi:DNA-binding transcriptional regulator LsrR (DeoR family)
MNNRLPNEDHELQQLVRISWLYYMEGLTHREIADRMGLSRVKVTRLLQQARNTGLVQIQIKGANSQFLQLEQALCKEFNLRDAVVVMEAESGPPLYRALAQGAADWLASRLQPGMQVGLSLGRTMSFIPDAFWSMDLSDCSFTEIIGGASDGSSSFESYSVASRLAELVGGQANYIYAPTIVSSKELRAMLLNEKSVAEAMERARHCNIALQSVGTLDEDSLLYQKGYLTQADLEAMRSAGAVGDVLCRYIDINGQQVENPLSQRCIALTLEDLKNIQWNACVAGGKKKLDIILGALRTGVLNVLITDAGVAQVLLERGRVSE